MSKYLRVGNLAPTITAQMLKDICSPFGGVAQVKMAESPFSGKSRGFGYIEMSSDADGAACLAGLNEKEYEGQKLSVSTAPADQFKKKRRSS